MSQEETHELPPLPAGYEFSSLLGHGGMSAVYLARQVSLDRLVALKVMQGELPQGIEAEARLIAKLHHPNIIGVYDTGPVENGLFIAMEYAPNGDLQRSISHGAMSEAKALDYTRQLLSALAKAHSNGLLHLDIKPANLLLDAQYHLKLADFGLAALNTAENGGGYGTPGYSAPELYYGHQPDNRTDLYAVGMVLYDLISGTLPDPYTGERPALPADKRISPRIWSIIEKSTAEHPTDRFESADQFIAALDLALGATTRQPVSATPPRAASVGAAHRMPSRTAGPRPRAVGATVTKPKRNSGFGNMVLSLLALIIIGALIWVKFKGVPEPLRHLLPQSKPEQTQEQTSPPEKPSEQPKPDDTSELGRPGPSSTPDLSNPLGNDTIQPAVPLPGEGVGSDDTSQFGVENPEG